MSSNNCDINTFILIVFVIFIVAFTDTIFYNLPVLKKLFTDQLNYILLIVLVLLLIIIDMPSGIILAFVILYLSVYVNYRNKKSKFNNVDASSINVINKANLQYQEQPYNDNLTPPLSESEFIYDNTNPFPNNNIPPFEPVSQEEINSMSTTKPNSGCGIKDSIDPEYITQVGPPSRDGYDITGCRYDFKNSPQNTTKYGPPLAQCSTYSGEQAKTCGTVFYPLHA
jgi:hypothetical protein